MKFQYRTFEPGETVTAINGTNRQRKMRVIREDGERGKVGNWVVCTVPWDEAERILERPENLISLPLSVGYGR